MGEKRKGLSRASEHDALEAWNKYGGKIGHVETYEDVADSEDEFHMNRDKIMLDDGPDAKRSKKWEDEDALLEPSDEEVLAYSEEDESNEEADTVVNALSDVENEEEDEGANGWGSSRREYYGGDEVLTEADAEALEKEALRIQQKRLKGMTEADFGLEDEWLDTAQNDVDRYERTITEVLKNVDITPEMSSQERIQILRTYYPEFDIFADEFLQLQPVLEDLQHKLQSRFSINIGRPLILVMKCRALAAYISSLAFYFALFSTPSKDSSLAKPMDPNELQEHPIMNAILKTREIWEQVKDTESPVIEQSGKELSPEPLLLPVMNDVTKSSRIEKRTHAMNFAAAKRAARMEAAEEELGDLSTLIPKSRKAFKKSHPVIVRDDNSDFGEETHLSSRAAAEKAQKKKSLRFYTSQIVQKSNKRAGAGRDAGGDMDVPYKERIKDRQARLNAESERRGKQLDEYGRGADLGGISDEEDINTAKEVRSEENQYYETVAKTNKKRKMDQVVKYDAIKKAKAENAIVRVVEGVVDEDGKRAIGYVIEKNKGLAPKRKKDVRNPRVKKRKKYEEKKKKLSSTRAVYKGGEERGGYGGEKTGIKTGLIKSIKL